MMEKLGAIVGGGRLELDVSSRVSGKLSHIKAQRMPLPPKPFSFLLLHFFLAFSNYFLPRAPSNLPGTPTANTFFPHPESKRY